MNSKTSICNMALAYLGQEPVSSISQDNERARWMGLFYEPVRDEVLRTHYWAFATVQKPLVAVNYSAILPGQFAYKYPADALFIRRVVSPQAPTKPLLFSERFDEEAQMRLLMAPCASAMACYTRRMTDETQFDPSFSKALALALASDAALALTADITLAAHLRQQYMLYLEEARRSNMAENLSFQPQTDAFSEVR